MTDRSRRFEPMRGIEGLGPEGQKLVLEVRDRLDAWIDENVDRLESETKAIVEAKRQEVASQASAVRGELAAARDGLADVLARLGTLEESFDAGDGRTVEEAVRETREVVQSARRLLDEREQRMKDLVQSILSKGLQALGEL